MYIIANTTHSYQLKSGTRIKKLNRRYLSPEGSPITAGLAGRYLLRLRAARASSVPRFDTLLELLQCHVRRSGRLHTGVAAYTEALSAAMIHGGNEGQAGGSLPMHEHTNARRGARIREDRPAAKDKK